MLNGLFKKSIAIIAQKAVSYAEDTLGEGKGVQKKQLAVAFIIDKLPVPVPFKGVISLFLINLIDESIEYAVKTLSNKGYSA